MKYVVFLLNGENKTIDADKFEVTSMGYLGFAKTDGTIVALFAAHTWGWIEQAPAA